MKKEKFLDLYPFLEVCPNCNILVNVKEKDFCPICKLKFDKEKGEWISEYKKEEKTEEEKTVLDILEGE